MKSHHRIHFLSIRPTALSNCNGLGEVTAVDMDKVIPDPTNPSMTRVFAPFGEVRDNHTSSNFGRFRRNTNSLSLRRSKTSGSGDQYYFNGGQPRHTSAPDYLPHDLIFDLGAEGITKCSSVGTIPRRARRSVNGLKDS
jgi:hypothetical protein